MIKLSCGLFRGLPDYDEGAEFAAVGVHVGGDGYLDRIAVECPFGRRLAEEVQRAHYAEAVSLVEEFAQFGGD